MRQATSTAREVIFQIRPTIHRIRRLKNPRLGWAVRRAGLRGLRGLAALLLALPPRGRILVSEPMSGGARPDRATDVYFAVYTLAMRTGRTRSAAEIAQHLRAAGFCAIAPARSLRPYVTSVIEAWRA